MKEFILHWYDGSEEKVKGTSISNAFARAGYGGGAIGALDYYEESFESKVLSLYHEDHLSIDDLAERFDVSKDSISAIINSDTSEEN